MIGTSAAIGAQIRAEEPGDRAGIRAVHRAAFGREDEATLVDSLRQSAGARVSLVAHQDGEIVGHVYVAEVSVGEGHHPAMGLGPVGVLPALQRAGIGASLCVAALEACRAAGHRAVFVLGHPEYYPRLGFVPASAHGLLYRSPELAPAYFVAELVPGTLDQLSGKVRYPAAYDDL